MLKRHTIRGTVTHKFTAYVYTKDNESLSDDIEETIHAGDYAQEDFVDYVVEDIDLPEPVQGGIPNADDYSNF